MALERADTVASALRKVLATQARKLREHEPGTRLGEDPEALHKMRTAVRRLRTAIRLLGAGISPGQRHVLERELAWLGRSLGRVRDLDVLLGTLARSASRGASRGRPIAITELETWLKAERARCRRELASGLDSARHRRLARLLEGERERGIEPIAPTSPTDASGSFLIAVQAKLGRAMTRLLERGQRIERQRTAPSDLDLHELRIRVRRLRHQLDLLSDLTGNSGRRLVAQLTRLQDVLGAHQDAVVAGRLMRRCIEQLRPGAAAAIAKLGMAQARRAATARAALGVAWARFASTQPNIALATICQRLQDEGRRARPPTESQERDEVTSMTCTLYLVRHAIAEVEASTARDADRKLTREGIVKMRRVARGLQRIGVEPDLVLSSPLTRAMQTAELLCNVLAPELRARIHPPLAPSGSLAAVLRDLPRQSGAHHVCLVGHEPDLGRLAALLLTGSPSGLRLPFKKGGVVAIEVTALPPRSKGQLQWSLTPKQLRALGGARS